MSTLGGAWRYKQHTYTPAVWGYLEPLMTTATAAFPISTVSTPPSDLGGYLQQHMYSLWDRQLTVPQQERDYAPSKSNFRKLKQRGCLNKGNRWTNCLIHALTVFFLRSTGEGNHTAVSGFVWMSGSHHSHKLILLVVQTLGPLVIHINAAFIG